VFRATEAAGYTPERAQLKVRATHPPRTVYLWRFIDVAPLHLPVGRQDAPAAV